MLHQCNECEGSGECEVCLNDGEPCSWCHGGACPACDGDGCVDDAGEEA